MRRARSFVLLFAACSLLPATLSAQKEPTAADVLGAVGRYLGTHASSISGVTLREDYTLRDVSGGRVQNTRRIASDVVLLDSNGRLVALRDPFAVDDNRLRERTPRITNLLVKPTRAAWDQAQAFTIEFLRYFADDLIARLNDPTLALRFAEPDNQARSAFKLEGRKKIEGVETVGLAFQEIKRKQAGYIVETPGNASARGKLWVEPATGRIVRTELSLQSDTETARITVDYTRDAGLDAWLPASMVDTYEVSERVGTGMSNMGAGSPVTARRSFDCRATYSKASHTPIQLKVIG